MKAASRRRAGDSMASDHRPPPPTPTNTADPWMLSTPVSGRESDASFCSSRPSIVSMGRPSAVIPSVSDRSYQASALRAINSYLASQSVSFSLKHPLPSAKDITETLKFLLRRLGFASQKMDDDLSHALKLLKCPLKLNKSALRAPGTPHSWPNLLAVIHWLVQIIKYKDFVADTEPAFKDDVEFMYTINSYLYYIKGDDESMDALDEECIRELTEWKVKVEETLKRLEENVKELELKLEGLNGGPSQKEILEQERTVLEKDVTKFHMMIEQLDGHLVEAQKKLDEKDNALEAKIEDRKRICQENEELKKKIEEQGINLRDAERMKRELQALDRDIEEAEVARNGWEEKIWDLDSQIAQKFKELEHLSIDSNQAIRRLKIGGSFQYTLNGSGCTPSEVLGSDYKTILKPALVSFLEELKKSSMEKLEVLISLRQQSNESAAKLEEKQHCVTALRSHIDEIEAQLSAIKKETHEYALRSASEARKMVDEVETDALKLSLVEKEAAKILKKSKDELQETIEQTEKEIMVCALELFHLVNSVSTYKDNMESKIERLKNDHVKTTRAVAEIYKGYEGLAISDS